MAFIAVPSSYHYHVTFSCNWIEGLHYVPCLLQFILCCIPISLIHYVALFIRDMVGRGLRSVHIYMDFIAFEISEHIIKESYMN
jgi:hypothetical protein